MRIGSGYDLVWGNSNCKIGGVENGDLKLSTNQIARLTVKQDGKVFCFGDVEIDGTFKGVKRIEMYNNNTRVGDWQTGEGLNTGSGYDNTFIGAGNARYMTSGKENTVVGNYNCFNWDTNSNIKENVVLGFKNAYYRKGPMYDCVVIGKEALMGDTTSPNNTGELYRHIAIGREAMQNWRRATYDNVAIGAYALHGSSTITNNYGCNNIAIGRDALRNTWHMSNQVAIGYSAGMSANCASTIYIGCMAGAYNTNATGQSIFMGEQCGARNNGCYNIAMGKQALNGWTGDATMRAGDANVAIGYQCALRHNGHNNVFIGSYCGNQAVSVPHATTHYNTCVGSYAGRSLNQTQGNTFIGYHAGFYHNNPGTDLGYNTCVGYSSGQNISSGYSNTYMGYNSGFSTTSGYRNIAIGPNALYALTTENNSIAMGFDAGRNALGGQNIMIGCGAGKCDNGGGSGHNNIIMGQRAGFVYTTGCENVMIGRNAGRFLTTGNRNVFLGRNAGYSNTTGYNNTCVGYYAGYNITSGYQNTCIGYGAGASINTGDENTCVGRDAGRGMTTGESNVYLGHNANYYTTTGKYNIAIGRHSGCTNGTGGSEGDCKLYIGMNSVPGVTNTYGDSSYIYGYMKMNDNPYLRVNGKLGIGCTPTCGLELPDEASARSGIKFGRFMGAGYREHFPTGEVYASFSTDNHGSFTIGSNCHMDTNNCIKYNNTHGTMCGPAICMPGNAQAHQGSIIFYTADPQSVTAGNTFRQIGNTPTMHLDHNGKVGIGEGAPEAKLHVYSSATNAMRLVVPYNNKYFQTNWYYGGHHLDVYYHGSTKAFGSTGNGGSMYFNYYSAGGVYLAGSTAVTSDDRLKHNEQNIDNALNIINQLKPQKYFKSQKAYDEDYHYQLDASGNPITEDEYIIETGFIAQDVEKIPILNYLVTKIPDKNKTIKQEKKDSDGNYILDAYGNKITEEVEVLALKNRLALKYTDIFVMNVAATQELYKENQELKTKVATLESELAAIKQHLGI